MSRIPINDEDNIDPGSEPTDEEVVETEQGRRQAGGPESNEVLKLRAERDDLYQRLARAQADYQNSRKRLEADVEQRLQYANAQLINFERALSTDAGKTDAAAILRGMQIVHDQMMKVLGENHVQEIAPDPGTPFDPARHEALMQQPDGRYEEPTVTQLLQKGYALRDRTLRPAQVAVSKTS
jgi:molecular chaperone GrpE